ncbi:MAG TPA: hypothetical protein VK468_06010, partial [Pyrinomonadaceae bacterium]|nr:hypothetical protein [Pyrinomonadaceae bacterium]
GYINFYAKNDKKTALPYYYEVSQLPGKNKNEPRVYATIGGYYLESAGTLGKEIADLITKQKAAKTDEEKIQLDTEIKAKIGMFNGYAERSLDAFSRAYSVAKSDTPENKTYRDGIYKQLQDIYKSRFDKLDGLDAYVSSTVTKPLPNPTSEVTPITDPEPAKTTGAATPVSVTPTADAAKPAMTTTAASAKPVAAAKKAAAPKRK